MFSPTRLISFLTLGPFSCFPWLVLSRLSIARVRYIKIQLETIDITTRLWGICIDVMSIVSSWILIYRTWAFNERSAAEGEREGWWEGGKRESLPFLALYRTSLVPRSALIAHALLPRLAKKDDWRRVRNFPAFGTGPACHCTCHRFSPLAAAFHVHFCSLLWCCECPEITVWLSFTTPIAYQRALFMWFLQRFQVWFPEIACANYQRFSPQIWWQYDRGFEVSLQRGTLDVA